MEKDLELLYIKDQIKEALSKLDRNKIHILYFKNYFNLSNCYKYPLFIFVKAYNLFAGKPQIDHVAHISRFVYDEENDFYEPRLFEATLRNGMEENDLFTKLKNLEGVCWIETLNVKADKVKAKAFENKYLGIPYSKELAAFSGFKRTFKSNGGFCSWLESLFLSDQGIDISKIKAGNPLKITPADLFNANLGAKSILYQS